MIFTNFREIDGAGRIVISKDIRNHLNIKAGDMLHIDGWQWLHYNKKSRKKNAFSAIRPKIWNVLMANLYAQIVSMHLIINYY